MISRQDDQDFKISHQHDILSHKIDLICRTISREDDIESHQGYIISRQSTQYVEDTNNIAPNYAIRRRHEFIVALVIPSKKPFFLPL